MHAIGQEKQRVVGRYDDGRPFYAMRFIRGDSLKEAWRCGALRYVLVHTQAGARYMVFDYLKRAGIECVFLVPGGGAMHLNDAFGRSRIEWVPCHHEQACAMAAESYFRLSGRLAAVNVTSGPGGTNALTGVFGAWTAWHLRRAGLSVLLVDAWGAGFLSAAEVTTLVNRCTTYNFNAVVVQMRRRGDAFYNARWEPRAESIKQGKNFDPLALTLKEAHARGLVHRDIKPSNILIAADGRYVLTDFGIVHTEGATKLTRNLTTLGTPEYMSPEQGQGLKIDGRSDEYSLAVLAYEMIIGRPPYDGETPLAIVLKHITEPLTPPININPRVPQAVSDVISQVEYILRDSEAKDPMIALRYDAGTVSAGGAARRPRARPPRDSRSTLTHRPAQDQPGEPDGGRAPNRAGSVMMSPRTSVRPVKPSCAVSVCCRAPSGLTVYEPESWLPLFYRPKWLARLAFAQELIELLLQRKDPLLDIGRLSEPFRG